MANKVAFGSAGPQPVWYHGVLSRGGAEAKLKGTPDGTYLIRDSSSSPNNYVLSASETGRVSHYIIQLQDNGQYSIGDEMFPDLVRVLEFYKTHLLDTTTLSIPLPLEHAAQNGVLSANAIMEVEGLFNFTASDPEDLSFKKGDRLNILEKHEAEWWKAQSQLTLQIGCIPSNYVKVIENAHAPPPLAARGAAQLLARSQSVMNPPQASRPAPAQPQLKPRAPIAAAKAVPADMPPDRPEFLVARAIMDRVANAYDKTALSFRAGDIIQVKVQNENGLWEGEVVGDEDKKGHFPFTLVELLDSSEYDADIADLEKKFEVTMDEIYGSI